MILGPVLALPVNEDDPDHGAFTTAADLDQAVAFGLPHEDALKALTKNAAYIWGVGKQLAPLNKVSSRTSLLPATRLEQRLRFAICLSAAN